GRLPASRLAEAAWRVLRLRMDEGLADTLRASRRDSAAAAPLDLRLLRHPALRMAARVAYARSRREADSLVAALGAAATAGDDPPGGREAVSSGAAAAGGAPRFAPGMAEWLRPDPSAASGGSTRRLAWPPAAELSPTAA